MPKTQSGKCLVRRLAVTLWLLPCAGCGFGSAGVAAAVGKDGNRTTRAPTQLTLLTPGNGQSGRILLPVGIDVDVGEEVEVLAIEYALAGDQAEFRAATPALGFPTEVSAGTSVSGAALAVRPDKYLGFVWNSHHDLDALRLAGTITRPATARAVMRATIRNRLTAEVLTRTTGEFYVDQSLVATVAGGGVGDGPTPATATMLNPVGIATNGTSEVYVADTGNHRIRRIPVAGAVATSIDTLIGNGYAGAQTGTRAARLTTMSSPVAVTTDAAGNLFVAEDGIGGGSRLRVYERQSGLVFDLLAGFRRVSSIFLSARRQLYIADELDDRVWLLDLAGVDPFLDPPVFTELQLVGTFVAPAAVTAVESSGTTALYIALRNAGQVVRTDGTGPPATVAGGGMGIPDVGLDARTIALADPAALAATPSHFFVADLGADRLLVVESATLRITNVLEQVTLPGAPPRPLRRPSGLALDQAGNLFVVETGASTPVPGTSGHQVLLARSPELPAQARIEELAAGGATKLLTQSVGEVRKRLDTLVVERTTRIG